MGTSNNPDPAVMVTEPEPTADVASEQRSAGNDHTTLSPETRQPILAATAPAVAGLRPVSDLRQRRLIGVSAWALALGTCGLVLGVLAMIRLMGPAPGWFLPVFAVVGVAGLMLVVGGFLTVQYRRVPWILLGISSGLFVVGVVLLGLV